MLMAIYVLIYGVIPFYILMLILGVFGWFDKK